jgi:hypothetical protein
MKPQDVMPKISTNITFFLPIDVESSEIIDLIPNGRNVPVTNENRIRYIYLVANYRLNIQIGRQCKAFFRGLSTIIDPKWMRMFNQVNNVKGTREERLQQLVTDIVNSRF